MSNDWLRLLWRLLFIFATAAAVAFGVSGIIFADGLKFWLSILGVVVGVPLFFIAVLTAVTDSKLP